MSGDQVRNAVGDVQLLKAAVPRHRDQLQGAIRAARRDLAAVARKTEVAIEQARAELQRAERELQHAEAQLRNCREGCGGLQALVRALAARIEEARVKLRRARQAAQIAEEARLECARAMSAVEGQLGEHNSLVSAALAVLEQKLLALTGKGGPSLARPAGDLAGAVSSGKSAPSVAQRASDLASAVVEWGKHAPAAAVMTAEVISVLTTAAAVAGNDLKGMNINTPFGDTSTVEMRRRADDSAVEFVEEERVHAAQEDLVERTRGRD